MNKEIELISTTINGAEKILTQVTMLIRYETCGLCGERERVNELGEFMFPCPRKDK